MELDVFCRAVSDLRSKSFVGHFYVSRIATCFWCTHIVHSTKRKFPFRIKTALNGLIRKGKMSSSRARVSVCKRENQPLLANCNQLLFHSYNLTQQHCCLLACSLCVVCVLFGLPRDVLQIADTHKAKEDEAKKCTFHNTYRLHTIRIIEFLLAPKQISGRGGFTHTHNRNGQNKIFEKCSTFELSQTSIAFCKNASSTKRVHRSPFQTSGSAFSLYCYYTQVWTGFN